MGGQLVSEPLIMQLLQKIEDGDIDSWNAIHAQYDVWWDEYPLVKAIVALQALQRIMQTVELQESHWKNLIARYLVLCDQNAQEVYRSRKKDYDDSFRKIVYRNAEEMEAVLGRPEDNGFVKKSRAKMELEKELARRFSTWT
jgi:hypothetical protein